MSSRIKTNIIPSNIQFANTDALQELHLEAICIFSAIGFFLDQDTYWKNKVVLPPASINTLDADGNLVTSDPYFKWHYNPRDISFSTALEEFSELFETIINEQTQDKQVILPLSGGLDSRTQAVALRHRKGDINSYSYEYKNGYPETKIAKQIAQASEFNFKAFTIEKGYLWTVLEELSEINKCYSDFTSPRQMSIYNEFSKMGDVFSLGHWGDVLFDSMNLPELSLEQQTDLIVKKLLKRGGFEFANRLWVEWKLLGNFNSYFRNRIKELLKTIDINNTNAKLRAFKSLYWAPRWTSVNLAIFKKSKPISLPYYDNRMCEFICTLPESYLQGRQLQIAYIKSRAPELAKISWQDQRPFNLYNFKNNKLPYNLPYRLSSKLKRTLQKLTGNSYVQRNWELQFLGNENEENLKNQLLNTGLENVISKSLITDYLEGFTNRESLNNAHAINMLLVLSKFNQHNL